MEGYEEYAISDNALYEFTITDDTSYSNIQSDFAVNDILYNDQSELGVIRDFLYGNDQDNHEVGDIMNCESAEHENLMPYNSYNCYHLIEGAQDYAMKEVAKYGSKQKFKIRCYRVERSNNIIRRCTLVCEHFGQPEATKSKGKKKETTSKCVGCIWQINLSCSEKNNPHKFVYVTKLIDEHKNHTLDHAHYDFQESLEFTVDMIKDVEFFVTKINCSSQQIHKALEEKYSVKIFMPVLYRAHVWILQQIKKATFEAIPHVIFTDADPALLAAIQEEFLMTNAFHCMFHIAQNIPLNLKNNLRDFNYLQCVLYANKETWAKAFVLKLFIVEMSSTSRVESYNSKVKRLIFNLNTTLLELSEKLSLCILEEDKKTKYALFRASIPKAVLVATADTILPKVYNMLLSKNELRKYLKINLEDSTLFGEIPKFTNIMAKLMLNLVDNNKIVEMWGVQQYFFQVMLCSQAATFHIQLIRSHWYNDSEVSCNSAQEPFLVAQKFEIEQSVMMSWSNSVPYLNALVQSQEVHNINHKMLDEQDCQEPLSSDSNVTSDSEGETDNETKKGKLDLSDLMNPQKRKARGRPKGTDRMRYVSEPSKKTKCQLRCKICRSASYNRVTCSQRKE
ncbi:9948_t:CDS:2 [Cetraspora pellucida]|uniref:9948_t:CDS:1 n=1 Tax=Cetraspora pellucida TaxID=1433469 RepID=A0A9N9C216_9GLOM|nr:9948_t:CDS:2 [Cetraspora pellucida]